MSSAGFERQSLCNSNRSELTFSLVFTGKSPRAVEFLGIDATLAAFICENPS
jgi:hypothetical protein